MYMLKKIMLLMTLFLLASLLLVACGGNNTANEPAANEPAAATEEPAMEENDMKICQVTDAGGIDDRSFNATAWKGALRAQDELGVEAKYLESQQQTDYERNINAFLEDNCDLIVTVGFLLGDATAAAADANPDQKFTIVDYSYDPVKENVLGLLFATDQAGFLAGYVAAGVTQTGKVGTFGGVNIPPVTVFMDGFALGVQYYNEKHSTNVEVLGWDVAAQDGLFAGNFESTDDGRTLGVSLMDEGADVIMPVAGPVGLGTAAAAQERGNVYIVGVDTDWTVSSPDFADIVLTSVLKNMDVAVFSASEQVIKGEFAGGVYIGTLENNGVGLAAFNKLDSMVSSDLKAELEEVKAGIIAGDIKTLP
jgi:basic membrane protein A